MLRGLTLGLLLLIGAIEAGNCRYRESRVPPQEFRRPRSCTGAGSFIGEDYWTTVGYDGIIRDGRSASDFLSFGQQPSADGYVAYWITRTRYGNTHYESFGHATIRPDGRICAWFVGLNREIVDVCGGFRVLSRSRYRPNEPNPFEWFQGHVEPKATLGFHEHRIAKYDGDDEVIYGDARVLNSNFQGVGGVNESNKQFIDVSDRGEFAQRVWCLRRRAGVSVPDYQLVPQDQRYADRSTNNYYPPQQQQQQPQQQHQQQQQQYDAVYQQQLADYQRRLEEYNREIERRNREDEEHRRIQQQAREQQQQQQQQQQQDPRVYEAPAVESQQEQQGGNIGVGGNIVQGQQVPQQYQQQQQQQQQQYPEQQQQQYQGQQQPEVHAAVPIKYAIGKGVHVSDPAQTVHQAIPLDQLQRRGMAAAPHHHHQQQQQQGQQQPVHYPQEQQQQQQPQQQQQQQQYGLVKTEPLIRDQYGNMYIKKNGHYYLYADPHVQKQIDSNRPVENQREEVARGVDERYNNADWLRHRENMARLAEERRQQELKEREEAERIAAERREEESVQVVQQPTTVDPVQAAKDEGWIVQEKSEDPIPLAEEKDEEEEDSVKPELDLPPPRELEDEELKDDADDFF